MLIFYRWSSYDNSGLSLIDKSISRGERLLSHNICIKLDATKQGVLLWAFLFVFQDRLMVNRISQILYFEGKDFFFNKFLEKLGIVLTIGNYDNTHPTIV